MKPTLDRRYDGPGFEWKGHVADASAVRAIEDAIARHVAAESIELTWRLTPEDIAASRDLGIDPLLTPTPAFPREEKMYYLLGAAVETSHPNLVRGALRKVIELLQSRRLTPFFQCRGFGWRARPELPPYVYWASHVTLDVRKKGLTLACDLQCRFADEKPLLNQARARLRRLVASFNA